jgi:predicted O-methyltransferase YrrM
MARYDRSKRNEYIDQLFARENETLSSIRKNSDSSLLSMQVSPHEGKIISVLLRIMNAKKVVEIGLLSGYSAEWMMSTMPKDAKLYSFEYDIRAIERAKSNLAKSEHIDRIEFIHGDAEQTLSSFNETVDAVFIDANKSAYPKYFEHAKRIVRKGGLIIADNVFLFGNVYGEPIRDASEKNIEAMKVFNALVASDPEFESIILPTDEGMLVAVRV